MYGAEYQAYTDSNSHLHARHDHDVPCAVCYVTQHPMVYMVPAKYTCPSGWTREYHVYLMSESRHTIVCRAAQEAGAPHREYINRKKENAIFTPM